MSVSSLPDELVTGIIAQAGALTMKENGWDNVHKDIKRDLNVYVHGNAFQGYDFA